MPTYHLHVLLPSGIQTSRKLQSEQPLEGLRDELLLRIADGAPFIMPADSESAGEEAVILPAPGMVVIVRTEEAQQKVEEEARRQMALRAAQGQPRIPILGGR